MLTMRPASPRAGGLQLRGTPNTTTAASLLPPKAQEVPPAAAAALARVHSSVNASGGTTAPPNGRGSSSRRAELTESPSSSSSGTVVLPPADHQAPSGPAAAATTPLRGLQPIRAGGSSPSSEVFVCPEESLFYAQCIEALVLLRGRPCPASSIAEFGAGDGAPVISALLKCGIPPDRLPTVAAYEISPPAARLAAARAAAAGLADKYVVHNGCFWSSSLLAGDGPAGACLLANPPYLPARDASQLIMPALHGGEDGSALTRELLSARFSAALLLLSSYSNPVAVLDHARSCGYVVTDFLVQPLPFGEYTSQDVVTRHLVAMRSTGTAFWRDGSAGRRPYYFLAGVLFERRQPDSHDGGDGDEGQASSSGPAAAPAVDLTDELLAVLTAL